MTGNNEKDPSSPFITERIPTREHPSGHVSEAAEKPTSSIRRMGLWLLLASLGMLFGASLVGFLVLRLRADQWPPAGTPPLPTGLWISTALLIVLSAVLLLAERGVRAGRPAVLNRMLVIANLLAVAFLAAQTANWMRMAAHSVLPNQSLLVWFFYTLTILHAAHVLFGLVPLLLVTIRGRAGRYTANDHEGVHLVALYWHFLLVTWIAIMVVMRI